MPKTGLKTFVYSFSVSLFAIFAANGMYWRNLPQKTSDIKIPGKNITLFLKSEAGNSPLSAAPVKKIALNVLPAMQQKQKPATTEDEIIMADDFSLPEIPLEFEIPLFEPTIPTAEQPVLLAENAAPKPMPIQQEPQETRRPDKVIIPLQVPKAADVHSSEKAKIDNVGPETTLISNNSSAKKVIEREDNQLLLAASDEQSLPKLAAHNDFPPLPLEKSADPLAQGKNIINIGSPKELNQVALADKSVPIYSMEKTAPQKSDPQKGENLPTWEAMESKKAPADSPWLVAKADGALKNQRISQEEFYKNSRDDFEAALTPKTSSAEGVKIASETVKNLLIPIPEDILTEENLTPQLSYPQEDAPQTVEKSPQPAEKEEKPVQQTAQTETKPVSEQADENSPQKNKILASLGALFNTDKQSDKQNLQMSKTKDGIFSDWRKNKKKDSSIGKIMPTEMRLSFQPNRAEISGQTLRWIQAFATKAAENNNMTIEIRIDGTSAMDLQQKRLNLLHNILTNKGVAFSKINTVFTQREPNSFIIKTITHNNPKGANRNLNKAANGYYLQW